MRRIGLGLILLFCGNAVASTVGVISDTRGDTRLLRGNEAFIAAAGVEVHAQDIVTTGADAAVQIDMDDGTVFRLGPATRLELAQYRLDDERGVIDAGVKLIAGWLRFAVAKLKPNAAYRIHAPTLTLGIRGTEGVVEARVDETALAMEEGEVAVEAPDLAADANATPPIVRAREYLVRRPGARLLPAVAVPAAFWQRAPAHLRVKAARRAHLLPRRGLLPKSMRDRRPHVERRAPALAPGVAQQQRQHRQQQRRDDRQQTHEQRPRRQERERHRGRD